MDRRCTRSDFDGGKSLYVVELPRRRLDSRQPRPQARSHLGFAGVEGCSQRFPDPARRAQLGASVGPCAGDGDAGRLTLTSSRAALAAITACYGLSLAPAIMISLAIWLERTANSSRRRRAAAGSLSSTR